MYSCLKHFRLKYSESSACGVQLLSNVFARRWFGQPAAQTHPHLIQSGEVTPGITKEEYRVRRSKLVENILTSSPSTQHHVIIIPSATKVYMTQDIPYVFRQNSDFLYFCGFQEPDSMLVIEVDGKDGSHRSILFVPKKDQYKELWEGQRSGKEGALELTGVDYTDNMESFQSYITPQQKIFTKKKPLLWYDHTKPAHGPFHNKYFSDSFNQKANPSMENPGGIFQSLRVIKSEAEIVLMKESNRIGSESMVETMKFSQPGVNEAHLFAKMDFECRLRGAEYLAYPPVVAGGHRANTIHYISNNQIIESGDMVLMDAGCEYHGYASDITRTWPVSGRFSPAQRELYNAVLELQSWCIEQCSPNHTTLNSLLNGMITQLGKLLQQLGIISSSRDLNLLTREFCPHHVGHYLGMDVHDTDSVSRNIPLQPGMVVTIEPGVYIPSNRTDVPAEFRGQGIRIEDNILITESGCVNLTEHCPKHPTDIEHIVQSGVLASTSSPLYSKTMH